jgi:hypothetical protein
MRRQRNAEILSPSAAHMSPPEPPLPPATADVIQCRRVTLATIDGGASVVSVGGKRSSSATHRRRAHARRSTNAEHSSPPLRLYCIDDCYIIKSETFMLPSTMDGDCREGWGAPSSLGMRTSKIDVVRAKRHQVIQDSVDDTTMMVSTAQSLHIT